jgi:hypothetical protein
VVTVSNLLYQEGRTRGGDGRGGNLLISQVSRGERTRETEREVALARGLGGECGWLVAAAVNAMGKEENVLRLG